MTWQQRLQPASFRGVSFHIDTASGQGGRRVAVHQYLNQSQHWAEDMGQTAATERLQMFVIGADYDLQRKTVCSFEFTGRRQTDPSLSGQHVHSGKRFQLDNINP